VGCDRQHLASRRTRFTLFPGLVARAELAGALARSRQAVACRPPGAGAKLNRVPDDENGSGDDRPADSGPVEIEVGDVLDLHAFAPRDVVELVRDYLDLAVERGWPQVRVVHGKGRGVQREAVRRILAADARVESFGDAPAEAGGWGATWVRLRRSGSREPR
jgi:hypothetical protein